MKQNKTYLHLGVTLIVSACAVLMFYDTFFQSRVLLDFFDKLMQVLSPVIYGLAFAYLLAPIVDFFDRYIQKGLPKAKSSVIRGLSILITWLCVIAMIYLMFSILIPELVDSVKTLAANFETYYKTVYNWVTALMENEDLFSDEVLSDQVLSALEGYTGRNETFDEGLEQLKTVVKYLSAFGVPAENFAVDLTIARGLDYYTGTVYETTLLDHPEIGSVCSGGRYDNLAAYYTDKQLPGVGISIGLTRLFYVLGEQGMLNPDLPTAPADVLILPMTEDLSAAGTLATRLRDADIRTQLYTEQKKFKAKMNYADKTGVPYVLFLGEDEIKAGVIACKDMTSGEQTTLPFDETLARIRAGLAERNKGTVILEK